MTTYNKTLVLISSKLGLSDDDKVLRKAAEFERLLQAKSTAGSNMTDTSKFVICLDLAASLFGAEFDLKTAIKYSGLKGPSYANCKKVVENLLELNTDKLTTSLLCASLQCSGVQELADRMLVEYHNNAKMELDMSLPQYICMAVYQACRLNKIKVSKAKLIEKARMKPAQWTKLDAEWSKLVEEKFATLKTKRGRPAKTIQPEEINEKMDVAYTKNEPIEPQIELYEDWKRRILEEAYREMKEYRTEEKTDLTPRRSPRKTPQKFAPYSSPVKKGVRSLFSNE